MAQTIDSVPASQVPRAGALTLDHIAHFVPDIAAATASLQRLGFTLTPFSAQSHRLTPGGPLVPAGTGNRCVMFERGYLEFLTPTAKTPVADQLRTALARYVGVHLVAFGTATPDVDHSRLTKHGFAPLAPVALQREIEVPSGTAAARFTLVRVTPGTMPEGRIQFCQHHTPELLWQSRWLSHGNGVCALSGVVMAVADVNAAAERYARYTGLSPRVEHGAWTIETARGDVLCASAERLRDVFHIEPPTLPWMGGAVLTTTSIKTAADAARTAGCITREIGSRLLIVLPPALGGFFVYEPPGSTPIRLS